MGMPLAGASDDEEEVGRRNSYSPFGIPLRFTPVNVPQNNYSSIFCVPPFFGPLLFDNTDSDARDHCANERTFVSYHLKSQPSRLELRMAKPLGIIFWLLSLSCLALGFGNYIKTVNKYSRRAAIVQTGWKTQSVLTVIAFSIVAVCVLFLATNSKRI